MAGFVCATLGCGTPAIPRIHATDRYCVDTPWFEKAISYNQELVFGKPTTHPHLHHVRHTTYDGRPFCGRRALTDALDDPHFLKIMTAKKSGKPTH